MKLTRKTAGLSACLAIGIVLACERSERLAGPQANVVLPARPGDVDTSRLIKKFRDRGAGNVFIVLTGEPSAAALAELGTAGVQAPPGRPGIVTFDSLKIATVWGYLTARDVRSVALIPYVVRIESSEDERTILPHASNPPVDAGATDIGWNLLRVRAPDMWRDLEATGQRQLSPTGWQSAGVAVLDDGGDYRLRYPVQNWQFFTAYATSPGNFTTDTTQIYLGQHGTDVGSLVAGEPNGLWGVGVAPRAAVAFSKVLPSADDWGPIVQGLNQAYTDGPAVVNMGFGNCGDLPPSTVQTAISRFTTRVPADAAYPGVGVSLVASAGNGTLTSPTPCPTTAVSYPAAYPEVIAVAAIDQNNATIQGFSVGPDVELSAPGICVNGLLVGGGSHTCLTGTSFAAAHVAGLIAAIRAKNNTSSAADVRTLLGSTATKIPGQTLPRDDRFGYGLINAYDAANPVPASAPDTEPADLFADSNVVSNTVNMTGTFVRNVVNVLFAQTATQAQRQAAVDRVRGQVVGGERLWYGDGFYLVRIHDDGTDGPLWSAIATLEALPYVEMAGPEALALNPLAYRRPEDGLNWTKSDWGLSPDSASGQNWAMEAINAPLAWGCDTGSSMVAVATVDERVITPIADLQANVQSTFHANAWGSLVHATPVASLLSAVGNNNQGITGLMWRSSLRMYDDVKFTSAGVPMHTSSGDPAADWKGIAARVGRAASEGARVINVSLGQNWFPIIPGGHQDSVEIQRAVVAPMAAVLRLMSAASAPLIVFSAGNESLSAWWTGYPQLAAQFPTRVIVVAASTIGNQHLAAWSDTGSLVTVAAPGDGVYALDNNSNVRSFGGTSFAAPLVSGLAGLLFSFDPTLTTQQVRDYIVNGARQGNRTVDGVPLLNAYESLKLAAQRPGAPLCGNRVWRSNNAVVAERDPVLHTTETLVNLGEAGAGVNVRHGGHRFEVATALGDRDRAFELRQGQWVETQDTATTLAGGTFSSMWARSHDGDSAASFIYSAVPGSAAFEINIYDFRTRIQTHIGTLVVPTSQFTGFVCVQLDYRGQCVSSRPTGNEESVVAQLVFPSVGGRLLLAVTYFATRDVGLGGWQTCPQADSMAVSCRSISYQQRTERAELWAVDPRNGQDTHLWTFPDRVFWFGASEDGAQLVSGEGVGTVAWSWLQQQQTFSDPGTVTGCAVHYHPMAGPTELVPAIPTVDACTGFRGQGTVAPAPPRASSP